MPAQRLATTVSRGSRGIVKQAIRMSLHDCGMLAGWSCVATSAFNNACVE
jgi:hypothetical protein